jgi:hypothetical protein
LCARAGGSEESIFMEMEAEIGNTGEKATVIEQMIDDMT